MNNSGSGATITVTDGSHAIAAPVVLADNLTVSNSGTLTFDSAGSISDSGTHSLTVNGPGNVVIAANGTIGGAYPQRALGHLGNRRRLDDLG